MDTSELWCFSIVRAHGLRLMRSEKSWRPVIAFEIDKRPCFETTLGVDGQNPNLKERFYTHEAHVNSQVEIHVCHHSQSKKKKKRTLVASVSHSLGELLRWQEKESHQTTGAHEVEVHLGLKGQSSSRRSNSNRSKSKNAATLLLRLWPPSTVQRLQSEDAHGGSPSVVGSSSDIHTSPTSPTDETWPHEEVILDIGGLRQRKLRGYTINSDDEVYSSDDKYNEDKPFMDESICDDGSESDTYCGDVDGIATLGRRERSSVSTSLLPQHRKPIEVSSTMAFVESFLSTFTVYDELKSETLESHDKIFVRLQMEWTYIGGLLIAMIAISTTIFAISSDSIFVVQPYAQSAIAASTIASGLGIVCDAWFLLRYTWTDIHTFMKRAKDIYGTYLFFALSSRVPAICFFVSALALMVFLSLVIFDVWRIGMFVMFFVIGMLMTLQFLVFGVHRCALGITRGARSVIRKIQHMAGTSVVASGGDMGL